MGVDKKKSSNHGSSQMNLDIKREEVLRAIVLGDSFDRKFAPVTLEKPRTLLPLVNIPLLDYTLEFLTAGGIEEIYIVCTCHAEQIKEYVETSRWSNFKVFILLEPGCNSVGEVLRACHDSQLFQSDFVLISGDVISNMDLSKALKVHKERREKDKNAIMTMVFKQASPTHRTRSKQDDTVIGWDQQTSELVYYGNSHSTNRIALSIENIFSKHQQVQLRYDLIDCHIDICSPEVLALFHDNFDFLDIRKDFIPDLLSNELLEHQLHTYVLQGEYAARVKDLRTYHSVSKDIIHRWTFPMVPDNNFMCNSTYSLYRQMIYKEKMVKMIGNCKLGEETVIGKGCELGDGSVITHSVLGRNCIIGRNVQLHGCYLWDGVVVQDNAIVRNSLLCDGSLVCNGAVIEKGSIISFGVIIGQGLHVEKFSKFTLYTPHKSLNDSTENDDEDEDDDESSDEENEDNQKPDEEKQFANATVQCDMGPGGKGKKWIIKNEKYNEIIDDTDMESDDTNDDLDESDSSADDGPTCNLKSTKNSGGQPKTFHDEVQATVRRAIKEKHSLDNLHIEIRSLRLAYVKESLDCVLTIFPVLLEIPDIQSKTQKEISVQLSKNIEEYSSVIKKFSLNTESQVDFIFAIQDFCDENTKYQPLFKNILFGFYQKGALVEQAIINWSDETKSDQTADKSYLEKCQDFIDWLLNASEEEDDSDEESEEESEEETDESD
ncbi:bacterial transferase hexapeptide repeat-containing protein [Tieghemostelium lacteum]|uniref:Translation initiation factor eIF2B subunit epsilon n=1 Tax=Tieghemostelium lacteum TaxID=361077 RepID=A0A151ZRU9_TIELA|nr:bacterial transferase hexapeptide repeat-containing protein [Tieghemostelium lacteum]|eukprot:KYQ96662.1 bacterial transferase hexapeptide repeat-containing protein [Tieghemostelium lacteum]